jgi:hypothetical protein
VILRPKLVNRINNFLGNLAFSLGEKVKGLFPHMEKTFFRWGSSLITEPTMISDSHISVLSATQAKVTWITNHPATGKVHYHRDQEADLEAGSDNYTTQHQVVLTDLTPDSEYTLEIVSDNTNVVYDANKTFQTVSE